MEPKCAKRQRMDEGNKNGDSSPPPNGDGITKFGVDNLSPPHPSLGLSVPLSHVQTWPGYAPVYEQPPNAASYRGFAPFAGQFADPSDPFGTQAFNYFNIRYPEPTAKDPILADGLLYGIPDTRNSLPPFSSLSGLPARPPQVKDEYREFDEGLAARLAEGVGNSSRDSEYGEGLSARLLERGLTRNDPDFSNGNSVQYRPWEAGRSPANGASPSSPSSNNLQDPSNTNSENAPSRPSSAQPNTPTSQSSPNNVIFSDSFAKYHPSSNTKENHNNNKDDLNQSGETDWVTLKEDKENHNSDLSDKSSSSTSGGANSQTPKLEPGLLMPADNVSHYGETKPSTTLEHFPSFSDGSGHSNNGTNNGPPSMHFPTSNFDYYSTQSPHQPHNNSNISPWDFRELNHGGKTNGDNNVSPGSDHGSKYVTMTPYLSNYLDHASFSQNGDGNYGNGTGYTKEFTTTNILPDGTPINIQTMSGGPQYILPHKSEMNSISPELPNHQLHQHGLLRGGEIAGQVPSVSSTVPHHPPLGHQGQRMDIPKPSDMVPRGGHQQSDVPVKPKKQKRKRCGECYGCLRKDNCGECAPCRNEKSHQICKVRRCEKLIEKKGNHHHPPPPTQSPMIPVSSTTPHSEPLVEKLPNLSGKGGETAWW